MASSEKQDNKESVVAQRAERTPIYQTGDLDANSDDKQRGERGNSDGLLVSANNPKRY